MRNLLYPKNKLFVTINKYASVQLFEVQFIEAGPPSQLPVRPNFIQE